MFIFLMKIITLCNKQRFLISQKSTENLANFHTILKLAIVQL